MICFYYEAQVPSANTEWEGIMTFTATSLQEVIEIFWLHSWSPYFIQSMADGILIN